MQIVIDIPNNKYDWIKEHKGATDFGITQMLYKRVRNGTPLPERHGRLIDADKLEESFNKCAGECGVCHYSKETGCDLVYLAPTVIEADKDK